MESHDDAVFAKWAKEKTQEIADARNHIYQKKKSLKRRKDCAAELNDTLECYMQELTKLGDLVRKLASGTSEGRHLYDSLLQMPDVQACKATGCERSEPLRLRT